MSHMLSLGWFPTTYVCLLLFTGRLLPDNTERWTRWDVYHVSFTVSKKRNLVWSPIMNWGETLLKMSFTKPLLAKCKSCLAFIKSKSCLITFHHNKQYTDNNSNNNEINRIDDCTMNNCSLNLSDGKSKRNCLCWYVILLVILFLLFASVSKVNQCCHHKNEKYCLHQMVPLSNGCNKCKIIIYVLYANDCENGVNQLSKWLPLHSNGANQRNWEAIFQPKLVNVHEEKQLSAMVRRVQSKLKCRQLSTLVCILISGVMSNLVNCDTSALRSCLDPYLSHNIDSHNYNGMPILFALYDEANEINMFRIKYRLSQCTFIATEAHHFVRHLVYSSVRLYNEFIVRNHCVYNQVHQQQQQPATNNETNNNNNNHQQSKALFKVFPKAINEVNE